MIRKVAIATAAAALLAGGAFLWSSGSTEKRAAEPVATKVEQRPSAALDRAHLVELASSPEGAEKLRAAYTASTDRAERVRLLDAAAQSPDRRSLELLVSVAAGKDPLSAHAGTAIGQMNHRGLSADFASLARSHESVLVRSNAVRALARSRATDQIALLADLVANPAEPLRVRQEAAFALGQLRGDESVAALVGALDTLGESAELEQLRISIVQALGTIANETAMAALERHRKRQLSATELAFVDRALAHRKARG